MAERSRSFGPTVLVGVASAALTAVAAGRDWATASAKATSASATGSSSAPLAIALALLALAAWGVVLVVRGRVRRLLAVVGALAAAGVVATVLASGHRVQVDAARAVQAKGALGPATDTSLTAWYVVCVVAAVVATVTLVVAVVAAPRWPAMGSRYDAPATQAEAPAAEQDMWRALDQGRDPTE